MSPLIATAVAATLFAAGEKSWLHVPVPGEFRTQRVERAGNERDWPFSVSKGVLACAYVLGRRQAYFVEWTAEDDVPGRVLMLSTNPFDLAFGNLAGRSLFRTTQSLEELIQAVSPFVQAGERLCEQPQGAIVGPGEL